RLPNAPASRSVPSPRGCSSSNSRGLPSAGSTAGTCAPAAERASALAPARTPTRALARARARGVRRPRPGPSAAAARPTAGLRRIPADTYDWRPFERHRRPDRPAARPGTSMSKALIIAEKPSVAADIARALGGFARQGDYFESDDYVLSSAVGHLVEIAAPEQYEVKRGKWSFAHLPVIPPHFDVHPIARNEDRLKLLARLIRRKDVDRLINACDAGREGELIFRLIVQHTKAKQPIQR